MSLISLICMRGMLRVGGGWHEQGQLNSAQLYATLGLLAKGWGRGSVRTSMAFERVDLMGLDWIGVGLGTYEHGLQVRALEHRREAREVRRMGRLAIILVDRLLGAVDLPGVHHA